MSEIKKEDQHKEESSNPEKILKEVLDCAALRLYVHWIGNGMQKFELNESNPKLETKKSRAFKSTFKL